jgi:hypothetical protein
MHRHDSAEQAALLLFVSKQQRGVAMSELLGL